MEELNSAHSQHLQVEDEENTEEIQQPVDDEENTPEMAMQLGLPPPEALDLSGGSISQPIGRSLNRNVQITKLRPEEVQRIVQPEPVATLLTVIGNIAIVVFNTKTCDEEGDDKKIEKVLLKFEEHCEPKKNVSYKFFSRAQESGKSIDQYITIKKAQFVKREFGTLKSSPIIIIITIIIIMIIIIIIIMRNCSKHC